MKPRVTRFIAIALITVGFTSFGVAVATEAPAPAVTETGGDEGSGPDPLVEAGRSVFEDNCSSCHQPDGRGVSGVFPPLRDNPRVADSVYVQQVVTGGLTGEIEVDGVSYNGAMPAFPSLSADEVAAVTAYIQEGLGAPGPVSTTVAGASSTSSPGLPGSAVLAYTAAFGLFAVVVVLVLGSLFVAKRSDGTFTTGQVWLKSGLIFLYFVVATVFIPSMVVEAGFLAQPPSIYEDLLSSRSWGIIRDLIGTGVWLAALVFGFWALRRAQRQNVI
jgi:mono/diheme cytochrome c family protein